MFDSGDPFEANAWEEPSPISIARIMLAWGDNVRREEPWCEMPLDDRSGELRPVLEEILDPSGGLDCPVRRRRICGVARAHGVFRRRQRCPELIITSDLIVLREAFKHVLRCGGVSRATTRDAVRELLPDWNAARRAACAGYADTAAVRDSTI